MQEPVVIPATRKHQSGCCPLQAWQSGLFAATQTQVVSDETALFLLVFPRASQLAYCKTGWLLLFPCVWGDSNEKLRVIRSNGMAVDEWNGENSILFHWQQTRNLRPLLTTMHLLSWCFVTMKQYHKTLDWACELYSFRGNSDSDVYEYPNRDSGTVLRHLLYSNV